MDNQNQDEQTQTASGLFSTATSAQEAPAAEETTTPAIDPAQEREMLMQRARLIGVDFSNNIGTETLRARIRAKMEADDAAEQAAAQTTQEPEALEEPAAQEVSTASTTLAPNAGLAAAEVNALTGEASNAPKKTLRQQVYEEQMRLVRIRVTCMDPKKKDLQGEIFTIANEYLGTVRKFVPFGEATENGYHVPYCIYTMMKEREFLNIRTTKDPKTGTPVVKSSYAKEFAIEVLEPLTEAELARLATAQIAAGSIDTL